MRQSRQFLTATALVCFIASGAFAQPGSLMLNRQRLDFRDLGQRGSNLIQPDDSKITSLAADPSTGRIYGGTSVKRAQIFAFEPSTSHVRPVGVLSGAQGVRNAVAVGSNGVVFFGTGRDMTADQPLSADWGSELGRDHIVKKMWADIQASYDAYPGGHIYRFDPANWDAARYQANHKAAVEDLGIPVPGEGIYCLEGSPDGRMLYGVTYPHGKFFVFDIAAGQTEVVGETWSEVIFAGPRRALRSLPGDLIVDAKGRCLYTSDSGRLAYYDPSSKKLVVTGQQIPGEFYPVHYDTGVYHPVVETWTLGRKHEIFGGTNDGYLFRVEPVSLKVTNLGKPRITRRIRGLAVAADGQVYGVAGENRIGCTLFSSDPRGGFIHHDQRRRISVLFLAPPPVRRHGDWSRRHSVPR